MTRTALFDLIREKRSFLCIGLDSDIDKLPPHLLAEDDPVFEFNKAIIDATHYLAIAYKPNLAFYESRGIEGWRSLEKTVKYLENFDVFKIADAKRGDIGNTSEHYAKAFFGQLNFDAVTVAPYMGIDSVSPFLGFDEKWVILLALTSNSGASDFQFLKVAESSHNLFAEVLEKSQDWGGPDKMMYVVGATKAAMLQEIRTIVPDHFLLVPGIGAQGGSLEEVAEFGMNKKCGLIVNSSRGIIFASQEKDFAEAAAEKAKEIQLKMEDLLKQNYLIK